jgi:hypothetical protein
MAEQSRKAAGTDVSLASDAELLQAAERTASALRVAAIALAVGGTALTVAAVVRRRRLGNGRP